MGHKNRRNHLSFVGFGEGGKACLFLWTQRPITFEEYLGEVYPAGRDWKLNKAVLEISQSPTIKCQGRLTPHCISSTLKKIISDPKCSIILSIFTQTALRTKVPPIPMCGCILENAQLKSKRERKGIIQTKRLTVQPIFLPSTSPIFMQSLKQKVMKVKRNDVYPLIAKHTSEKQTYLAQEADWNGAAQRHLGEQLTQVCKGLHVSFSRAWNTSIVKKVNVFF